MHTRNLLIQHELKDGNPVQFRVRGHSMQPRALKGDCVIFEPVIYPSTLMAKDIVFCNPNGGERFCAHMISEVQEPPVAISHQHHRELCRWLEFTIGTQSGHRVGNCYGQNIYGRLVEVLSPS